MTDPERDHLLNRIKELDRARRRWKWLALAGIPVLVVLCLIAAGNGISSYVLLRDRLARERQAAEDSRRAVEEALLRADEALAQKNDALARALADSEKAFVEAARVSDRLADDRLGENGLRVHRIESEYQDRPTQVRVLLPDRVEPNRRYPVLYVLPVEAGTESRYGDGLAEVKKLDLHNKFGLICVAPTFARLPWYADHPTDRRIWQETYLLKAVLPLVEKEYPALAEPKGRLLVGFSKSGWGAFSLLLRHPDVFGRAAAWDAPMEQDRPGRYGSVEIFGTEDNFEKYRIAALLEQRAADLGTEKRLALLGYGKFREQHRATHARMERLKVAHGYHDGPERGHAWDSGWLAEAVVFLTER
jgi:S-formylglutathione hydrolase FrmB